ncbi:MAG: tetratricopeptide repeat protein [Inhella sp.]
MSIAIVTNSQRSHPMVEPQALRVDQAQLAQHAYTLLGVGRAAEALELAERLVAVAPMAPDALQLRAICMAESGQFDAAEQGLRAALDLLPGQPAILANLATLLRRAGRLQEALDAWSGLVLARPMHAASWMELGQTALAMRMFPRAREAFRKAVELQAQYPQAWQALAETWRAEGDLEAAEDVLRQGLRHSPDALALMAALGQVLRLAGRADEALPWFTQATTQPDPPPAWLDAMAGALLDSGRVGEALNLIQSLTDRHPGFAPAQVTRARMLWEHPRAAVEPLAQLETLCRQQVDAQELQLALLGLLIDARRLEAALAQVERLRAREDSPLMVALQADVLQRMGRVEEAGPLYARAHSALSGDADFLNAHARHLLSRAEPEAAARCAEQAIALDAHDQEAWACLSTAWRLLGDEREQWLCDYERLIAFVEIEPPPGFGSLQEYLGMLARRLHGLHQAQAEPMQLSLRGGSQTAGRLFGRADALLDATQRALQRQVDAWLAALPSDNAHPFLSRRRAGVRFSGSWSVRLRRQGCHVNHIHRQGWLSSAFYVELPPSVLGDGLDGCIGFGEPPKDLGLDLAPRRLIKPKPGHLALFPSYMWHGTRPFDDDAVRLTIAFDMLPSAR